MSEYSSSFASDVDLEELIGELEDNSVIPDKTDNVGTNLQPTAPSEQVFPSITPSVKPPSVSRQPLLPLQPIEHTETDDDDGDMYDFDDKGIDAPPSIIASAPPIVSNKRDAGNAEVAPSVSMVGALPSLATANTTVAQPSIVTSMPPLSTIEPRSVETVAVPPVLESVGSDEISSAASANTAVAQPSIVTSMPPSVNVEPNGLKTVAISPVSESSRLEEISASTTVAQPSIVTSMPPLSTIEPRSVETVAVPPVSESVGSDEISSATSANMAVAQPSVVTSMPPSVNVEPNGLKTVAISPVSESSGLEEISSANTAVTQPSIVTSMPPSVNVEPNGLKTVAVPPVSESSGLEEISSANTAANTAVAQPSIVTSMPTSVNNEPTEPETVAAVQPRKPHFNILDDDESESDEEPIVLNEGRGGRGLGHKPQLVGDGAVVRVQALARGRSVRRRLKRQQTAATKIQSVYRGKKVRYERNIEAEAATKIQSVYRGNRGRTEAFEKMTSAQQDLMLDRRGTVFFGNVGDMPAYNEEQRDSKVSYDNEEQRETQLYHDPLEDSSDNDEPPSVPEGQGKLTVTTQDGLQIPLQVDWNTKIEDLKQSLEEKSKIDWRRQRLIYMGVMMDDASTLMSHNVPEGSVILMFLGPPVEEKVEEVKEEEEEEENSFELAVREMTGNTYKVNVVLEDTVEKLKNKISIKTKNEIQPIQIRLIFSGRQLEDNKMLSDYNLNTGTTLLMAVRPMEAILAAQRAAEEQEEEEEEEPPQPAPAIAAIPTQPPVQPASHWGNVRTAMQMGVQQPDQEEAPPAIELQEEEGEEEDEDMGYYPLSFDVEPYLEAKKRIPYTSFQPTFLDTPPFDEATIGPREKYKTQNVQMLVPPNTDNLRLLHIESVKLDRKVRKNIGPAVSSCVNLQVLRIVDVGLQDASDIILPNLLILDLHRNRIKNLKTLVPILKGAPLLEALELRGNPVCETETFVFDVIVIPKSLKRLNGKFLLASQRRDAYTLAKPRLANLGKIVWDIIASSMPENAVMQPGYWQPELINEINLSDNGITEIHVGDFVNCEIMKLADNQLTTIVGAGFEQLNILHTLDVSQNMLTKADYVVFPQLPNLVNLDTRGNRFPERNHRRTILLITRNLLGMNHANGLSVLDDEDVHMMEKLDAVDDLGDAMTVGKAKWNMVLVDQLGNRFLHAGNFTTVATLDIPLCNLNFADVSLLVNLETLRLQDNPLITIEGLDNLVALKVIEVTQVGSNLVLLDSVLRSLSHCTTLKTVTLALNQPKFKKTRTKILKHLVPKNPHLISCNVSPVSVADRISAYEEIMSPEELARYRIDLGVYEQVAELRNRSYDPQSVSAGVGYDPGKVTSLNRMNALGLVDSMVDFSHFTSLQSLNLSDNKIKRLQSIRIDACSQLTHLDVQKNALEEDIATISQLLESLPNLSHVMLEGNPKVKRKKLLRSLPSLSRLDCKWRVIDTEITIDERIDAFKALNKRAPVDDVFEFRGKLALQLAVDGREGVTELPIGEKGLRTIDLTANSDVQVLDLHGNSFQMVSSIRGIEDLKQLRLLNISKNGIKRIVEIITVINELDMLEEVHVSGNPCCRGDYRRKIIGGIPRLREVTERGKRLHAIDDELINVDEVCAEWPKKADGAPLFRFESAMWDIELLNDPHKQEVQEVLDLTELSLSTLRLSKFVSLHTLNLSDNLIKDDVLDNLECGLMLCMNLTDLDLSGNEIVRIESLATLADKLPNLSIYNWADNPCSENIDSSRMQFLSKMEAMRSPGASLKTINGLDITIDERCTGLEMVMTRNDVAKIRLRLVLEEMNVLDPGVASRTESLDLTNKGLSDLSELAAVGFPNLRNLLVSHNEMRVLKGNRLHDLPSLQHIDLKDNQLTSVDDTLTAFSKCASIRSLELADAFKGNVTDESYTRKYFQVLRGVETINDISSPVALRQDGRTAMRYLSIVTDNRTNANSCTSMNLKDLGITKDMLGDMIVLLAALPVEILDLRGNPICRTAQYRLMIINNVKTLKTLDGTDVTETEVSNAIRLVGNTEMTAQLDQRKRSLIMNRFDIIKAQRLRGMRVGLADAMGAGVNGDDDKDDNTTMVTGSFLTKLELLISFIQLYAVTMSIIGTSTISSKSVLYEVTSASNWLADLDVMIIQFIPVELSAVFLVKFVVINVLPLILALIYWWPMNKDKWRDTFVIHYFRTVFLYILLFAVLFIGAFAASSAVRGINVGLLEFWLPTKFEVFEDELFLPVTLGFEAFPVTVFLVLFTNATLYKIKAKSKTYWFTLVRTKKRICLFFMTILFLPLVSTCLGTIRCEKGITVYYPDQQCLIGPAFNITLVKPLQWIAVIMFLIYSISIPVFFSRLVTKGSALIELTHNFKFDRKELAILRKKLRSKKPVDQAFKDEVYQKDFSLKSRYSKAVREYAVASAYLYSPYSYGSRYLKIQVMVEKLLLLTVAVIAPILPGFTRYIVIGTISVLMLLYTILAKPFSDRGEVALDIFGRGDIVVFWLTIMIAELVTTSGSLSFGVQVFAIIVALAGVILQLFLIGFLTYYRRVNRDKDGNVAAESGKKGDDGTVIPMSRLFDDDGGDQRVSLLHDGESYDDDQELPGAVEGRPYAPTSNNPNDGPSSAGGLRAPPTLGGSPGQGMGRPPGQSFSGPPMGGREAGGPPMGGRGAGGPLMGGRGAGGPPMGGRGAGGPPMGGRGAGGSPIGGPPGQTMGASAPAPSSLVTDSPSFPASPAASRTGSIRPPPLGQPLRPPPLGQPLNGVPLPPRSGFAR